MWENNRMANAGLLGPHPLTPAALDQTLSEIGPGAYALGKISKDGKTFLISYVGRSDNDLRKRLKDWIGTYPQFKYGYFATAKDAFRKECNLFHDFGETTLDNPAHPARPSGTSWTCPRCRALT
jgi:hypothetical protein